ncbi:MAG: M56 family metallopeptidase [Nakamurella sp.]
MISRGFVAVPVWAYAVGLIIVGLLLTAPVSYRLAGAGWTRRGPRPALLLWQAVCLAAGFSVVAGLVLLAVEPLGSNIFTAAWNWFAAAFTGNLTEPAWRIGCGLAAAALTIALLAVLTRTAIRTAQRRRAHRQVLDLLTTAPVRLSGRSAELNRKLRILDHRTAVAYTLPGWHARVVLSAGLVDLLSSAELGAVIEHERAHLRARHDLLVLPFQAWAVALGWVPGVRLAGASVAELTEMLADDVAALRTSRAALASALAKVALADPLGASSAGRPAGSPAIAGTAVADRVRRLLDPHPLAGWQQAATGVACVALLSIPASVLLLSWG